MKKEKYYIYNTQKITNKRFVVDSIEVVCAPTINTNFYVTITITIENDPKISNSIVIDQKLVINKFTRALNKEYTIKEIPEKSEILFVHVSITVNDLK